MSIGNFPEMLNRALLVGIISVGRLGVRGGGFVVWAQKTYHRPHFAGKCVKKRGVRFHRTRDFKHYYFDSIPPTSQIAELSSRGASPPLSERNAATCQRILVLLFLVLFVFMCYSCLLFVLSYFDCLLFFATCRRIGARGFGLRLRVQASEFVLFEIRSVWVAIRCSY